MLLRYIKMVEFNEKKNVFFNQNECSVKIHYIWKQLKNIHLKFYIKQKRTLLYKMCVMYMGAGWYIGVYGLKKKLKSTRHLNEKFRNRKSPIRG